VLFPAPHAGCLGIGRARTPFRAEKSQLTNHSFLLFFSP
jgi:hypothetical protein